MATQKKNPDASDAALSAIQEALGLGGDDATGKPETPTAPTEQSGEALPRLPRVEDIEFLASDPVGATLPGARLDIKPPQRRVKPPETKTPESRMEQPASPALEAAATPSALELLRNPTIMPANDDRRASVQELLDPLRQSSPRTPYGLAAAFSGLWIITAWLLLSKRDGFFYAADGALRPGIELPLVIAGIGVILPILFVFALAALHRRSHDLRNSARVMAEVAARLAEPESVGADAVFTLGQAVRREVASIGDGVERALSRATELESIVHGEVSALERSYADNEYKMRQLVAELADPRACRQYRSPHNSAVLVLVWYVVVRASRRVVDEKRGVLNRYRYLVRLRVLDAYRERIGAAAQNRDRRVRKGKEKQSRMILGIDLADALCPFEHYQRRGAEDGVGQDEEHPRVLRRDGLARIEIETGRHRHGRAWHGLQDRKPVLGKRRIHAGRVVDMHVAPLERSYPG
jgi:hypothetical protein